MCSNSKTAQLHFDHREVKFMSVNMASRIWLLVEWVDESNVFPSYGVVNVDTLAYDETDLHPGNLIFLRVKHENPRRAKILRISESKRYVKEQKEILERQDQQVKNVLQLCMRTIKEMKADNSFNVQQQSTSHSALPHVVVAHDDNSESDSDAELNNTRTRNFNKPTTKYSAQYGRKKSIANHTRSSMNANNSMTKRRSIVSSTPLPPKSSPPEKILLCFDQATQTEEPYPQPPIAKIEEMEAVLSNLYGRFQSLISQVNINSTNSTSMSESEHNEEVSYIEQNGSNYWPEAHVNEFGDQVSIITAEFVEETGADEEIVQNAQDQQVNSSAVKVEEKVNPNALLVRRMSAQTTNNIEAMASNDSDLVPIGNGNAKVPARLLNDIDWNSHTSATRQLLQAVFPRRVLATHCLTGKQSPAFLNRPPKKILDPKLVDDIVKTVSTRCGVPKNLVRNSITIKCTDEAKLYRNRQQYKHSRKTHQNEENIPPSTPSSDESNAVIN